MVHVLAVRAGMGEALQTLATLERFLATVQTLMLGQMMLVLERFWTFHALVRTLARMFVLVPLQGAVLAERLVTLITDVLTLGVRSRMGKWTGILTAGRHTGRPITTTEPVRTGQPFRHVQHRLQQVLLVREGAVVLGTAVVR